MEIFTKEQGVSLKEKLLTFAKDRKRVLLIVLSLLSVGTISLLLLLGFSQKPSPPLPSPAPLPSKPPSAQQVLSFDLIPTPSSPSIPSLPSAPSISAPKVSFETYKLETDLPVLPDQITLYTFKTNFSDQEVKDFAAKLGLFDLKSVGQDFLIAKNLDDPKNYGYLLFNKKTGEFTFESFGVHRPRFTSEQDPTPVAENFLQELGLLDETVLFHATYERNDLPGITFVEFHRDWDKVGLPILNIVGLLNLDEGVRLADFELGMIDQRMPDNENIINTSDFYDGKARPNDFNTITVAVLSDGTVTSIDSSLRHLETSHALTSQNTTFLAPEEALAQVKSGNGLFQLTAPSGEGEVDFARVYPQNLASTKEAVVTDFVLAFLEKPPAVAQNFLQPVYIFKGYATLDSGYRVNWVQAVPAIADTQISLPEVLGETIKLGTFTPTLSPPTPTPTPTPLLPTPTTTTAPPSPTPTTPEASPTPTPCPSCVPDEANLDPIYDLAGLGRVGRWTIDQEGKGYGEDLGSTRGTGRANNQWYFIPPKDQPLPDLGQVLAEFENLGLDYNQLRRRERIEAEWEDPNCPKRLTGGSPTLFIYAPEGTELTIKSDASLTYSDPAYDLEKGWQITVEESGQNTSEVARSACEGTPRMVEELKGQTQLNINGHLRPFIYYEYKPVSFEKPKEGWIIKKSELENFARKTISPALKLTPLEEDRLVFELNHASFDLHAETVFVGLIDQKEIDEKLPLEINSEPPPRWQAERSEAMTPRMVVSENNNEISPSILRYHFYLSQAPSSPSSPSLSPSLTPSLTPIPRLDFMILELGAVGY